MVHRPTQHSPAHVSTWNCQTFPWKLEKLLECFELMAIKFVARLILRPVKALQPSPSHLLLLRLESPGFPSMLSPRSHSSRWCYFSIVELCLRKRFPLVSAQKKHSNVIHFLICWRNSFVCTVYHVCFHEANDTQSVFLPQRHRLIEWQIAANAWVLNERIRRKTRATIRFSMT